MNIAVNKAHFPVTVLGYGRRIGIWLQGCSLRCPGCISRDTWEVDAQYFMPLADLLFWCRSLEGESPDGVTITGGEPFDQAEALLHLLQGLRQWAGELDYPLDLLCYSGYPYRNLRKHYAEHLTLLDAIIPGPYVETRPVAPLVGSDNQSVITLSVLGQTRYGSSLSRFGGKRMQVAVAADRIWFIGIPARGDMQRLEMRCQEMGLTLGDCSWRP